MSFVTVTTRLQPKPHDTLIIRVNEVEESKEYHISMVVAKLRGINIDKLKRWHPEKALVPIFLSMIEANGNEDFRLPTNLETLLDFYYLCHELEYNFGMGQSWISITKGLESKLYSMTDVLKWFSTDKRIQALPMSTWLFNCFKEQPQLLNYCHPIVWKKLVLHVFALDKSDEKSNCSSCSSCLVTNIKSKPIPDLYFMYNGTAWTIIRDELPQRRPLSVCKYYQFYEIPKEDFLKIDDNRCRTVIAKESEHSDWEAYQAVVDEHYATRGMKLLSLFDESFYSYMFPFLKYGLLQRTQ